MDATPHWSRSLCRLACSAIAGLIVVALPAAAHAADFRTQNFLVMAPTPDLARAVGMAAEGYRRDLAIHWLGKELPPWPAPCPIRVIAGDHLAAQGVTTYHRSPVRDFQMEVVGSTERILDSVLPHEVTHTLLATHFGRPLPRWADEGICTTVEHPVERQKHEAKLREFLSTRRGISMNKLFLMTEYPADVLPMYAQGYSVCQFLIAQRGPRQFVDFVGDYMRNPSWTQNVRKHYGYESLAELQQLWLAWVAKGSGPVDAFMKHPDRPAADGSGVLLASAQAPAAGNRVGIAPSPAAPQPSGAAQPTNLNPPVVGRVGMNPTSNPTSPAPGGWYSRLKDGTASPTSTPVAVAPANQRHTVSQPQPEQGSVGASGFGGIEAWPSVSPAPSEPIPTGAAGYPVRGDYRNGYRPGSVASPGHYLR